MYVVVGVWGVWLSGDEIYPVFSWRLFDHIPNTQVDYTVRIHQYGNTVVDPPVWFADSSGVFSSIDLSPPGYVILFRALGQSIEEKLGEETVRMARRELEQHFVVTPVVYELVKIIYNPIDFWQDRIVEHEFSLGTFTSVQGATQ